VSDDVAMPLTIELDFIARHVVYQPKALEAARRSRKSNQRTENALRRGSWG
jgi:hypothetical protein